MKKGTILRNLWAGHETYFICMNFPVRVGRAEGKKIGGYSLVNVDGKWKFKRADYYVSSIRDTEHFPVIGYVDFDSMVVDVILKSIGREPQKTNADSIRAMTDEELADFIAFKLPYSISEWPDLMLNWLRQPVKED